MDEINNYDWQNDKNWQQYFDNLLFPKNMSSEIRERMILKKKIAYYKRKVNNNFDDSFINQSSTSTSTSTSASNNDNVNNSNTTSSSSSSSSNMNNNNNNNNNNNGMFRKLYIIASYILLLAHMFMTVLFIFVFLGNSVAFYRLLKVSSIVQFISLLQLYGKPKLNKTYLQQILMNDESHYIMYALSLHMAAPAFILTLPIISRSLVYISRSWQMLIPLYLPFLNGLIPTLQKVDAYTFYDFAASMEIYNGFYFIVLLISPNRNFLMLFMYWQYLRLRYMISHSCRVNFTKIRYQFDQIILYSTWCPGIIKTIYAKIVQFMSKMGEPPQQPQEGSASRCTIS